MCHCERGGEPHNRFYMYPTRSAHLSCSPLQSPIADSAHWARTAGPLLTPCAVRACVACASARAAAADSSLLLLLPRPSVRPSACLATCRPLKKHPEPERKKTAAAATYHSLLPNAEKRRRAGAGGGCGISVGRTRMGGRALVLKSREIFPTLWTDGRPDEDDDMRITARAPACPTAAAAAVARRACSNVAGSPSPSRASARCSCGAASSSPGGISHELFSESS